MIDALRIAGESGKPLPRKFDFTMARLADAKCPAGRGRVWLYDRRQPGLAFAVMASGVKSFYFNRKTHGEGVRFRLGGFPDLRLDDARKAVADYLGGLARGVNPIAAREEKANKAAAEKAGATTLRELWDDWKDDRAASRKPRTIAGYAAVMDGPLADWMNRAARSITRADVLQRHRKLTTDSGPAYANLAMRTLSSVMGFAIKSEKLDGNPVQVLKGEWCKVKARTGRIHDDQLAAWFEAIDSLRNDDTDAAGQVGADYLEFVLLTGLRRNEAATLQWENVNLEKATVAITETKNGDPLVLPMSGYLLAMLKRRKGVTGESPWVFPSAGKKNAAGHIAEPRFVAEKVADLSGVKTSTHDLRRSFVTMAERLVPHAAVKALVNHRDSRKGGDITLGYTIFGPEELRPYMQTITDAFRAHAKS